jgi:DNA-binding response OmpR family regulator
MDKSLEGIVIAIVDDDPDIVSTVSDYFAKEGVIPKGFDTGESFFKYLYTERPDLIILDVVLPDMSGFQICKKLREVDEFAAIPIIMLSGQDKNIDKVLGLDLGADDYVTKPYSPDELLARVKAALRKKAPSADEAQIKIGDIVVVDPDRYQVTVDGEKAGLTPTEFNIMKLLASRKGTVFTREQILEHLWGSEKIVVDRTIDVHITHLREKLGKAGYLIKMIRGVGYKLDEED